MRITVRRVIALAAAGLVALVGVAFAAQSGQYDGPTSQKVGGSPLRISFNVSHGALSNVQLDAVVKKGGGVCAANVSSTHLTFTRGKVKIDHQMKFNGKVTDAHGDSATISGAFKAKTASGSFIVSATGGVQGTARCTSGKVRFTVQASGGQVKHAKYSGFVGAGDPISFRVSANGKAVEHLVVEFENTCHGVAGNSPPTFRFKTLEIKSGKFSGTATDHFGPAASDVLHISGTFFGRIAAGQGTDKAHITSLPDCTQTQEFTARAK